MLFLFVLFLIFQKITSTYCNFDEAINDVHSDYFGLPAMPPVSADPSFSMDMDDTSVLASLPREILEHHIFDSIDSESQVQLALASKKYSLLFHKALSQRALYRLFRVQYISFIRYTLENLEALKILQDVLQEQP